MKIKNIRIVALNHHPMNIRKDYNDLTELTDSIRINGLIHPLLVCPDPSSPEKYHVVAGNRRLEAAKLAGITELPCEVKELSLEQILGIMASENLLRQNPSHKEQSDHFQLMLDMGSSVAGISSGTGLSETTIRRRVKLQNLDAAGLKAAEERGVTLFDLEKIADLPSEESRKTVLAAAGTKDFCDILPGMNSEASKPTEHGDCAINRTSHKCGLTVPPAKVDAPAL